MQTKKMILTSFVTCLVTVLLIVAVFANVGTTQAQDGEPPLEDHEIEEEVLWNNTIHYAGWEFQPFTSNTTFDNSAWGCVYITGGDLFLYMGIHLPDAAIIEFIRFYFRDSSASATGILRLLSIDEDDYGTTTSTTLATLATTGFSDGDMHSLTWSSRFGLQNDETLYGFEWNAGITNSISLCGVYIRYQLPTLFGAAMPFITAN